MEVDLSRGGLGRAVVVALALVVIAALARRMPSLRARLGGTRRYEPAATGEETGWAA